MSGAGAVRPAEPHAPAASGKEPVRGPDFVGRVAARPLGPKWPARRDYAAIAALFVLSRGFLVAVGAVTLRLTSPGASSGGLLPDLFVRWDSLWYIALAERGYTTTEPLNQVGATNFAFYPVYPALIWALSHLSGLSAAAAGVVISNGAFLAALYVLYGLGRVVTGDRAKALSAVALISFVPEGFIFSAVYTESLFVLVTAGAMLAHSRQHHVMASILTAIGSGIRSNGVFIAVWFGLEAIRKRGFADALRFWEHPEDYLPAFAAPIGLLAFWWMCYLQTGDAFAQKSTVAYGWGWVPEWPWSNVAVALASGSALDRFFVIAGLIAFALSFALLRKGHWTLFAYALVNFALYFSGSIPLSLLRYSIVIFPIYFGLAHYALRPAGLLFILFPVWAAILMVAWTLGSVLAL